MKKMIIMLMAATLSLTTLPFESKALDTKPTITTAAISREESEAKVLLNRLNEIKAMDKSNLTVSEKKELRKEVRATKDRLREIHGGIYLSAGAVIIILLLLIILL